MKLRIATYNIHKGVTSFGTRPRIHALKLALSKLDADILFLQEVQGRHDQIALKHAAYWPEQPQHDFLAGDSHQAVYGMNAVYDQGHHGNALLSRFPIASSYNQDISDHAYESRGILHCVVQMPHTQIHCYVVHLGLFGGGRKRQVAALIEAVRSSAPPDAPVIIAGDFNDWGNRLGELLRLRLNVTEVFDQRQARSVFSYLRKLAGRTPKLAAARTFPAALPVLSLDRIYVRGLSIESAEVLHGVLWAKLSDHSPIVATLTLD